MVLIVLLLPLFVLLYMKSKSLFFAFSLYFLVAGRLFFFKIGNEYAPTVNNLFFFSIIFIYFFLAKKSLKEKKIIGSFIIVYLLYFTAQALILGNTPTNNLIFYKESLIGFLYASLLYKNIIKEEVSTQYLLKTLYILVSIQILLAWGQSLSASFCNYFRITEYLWKGEILSVTGNIDDVLDNTLMLGTLMGMSSFANFLCFSILILLYYEFSSKETFSFYKKIFFILAYITLFMSGVRAPFLIGLTGFLILLFKYKKLIFTYVIIGFSILFIMVGAALYGELSSDDITDSREDAIERIRGSIIIFTGNVDLIMLTTFGISLSMFSYITQNPLFGVGLHESTGYFLQERGRTLESLSITDAMLCYIIAEIGVFGLLIYVYPFILYIKTYIKKMNIKVPYFLLGTLLLMSIVDTGIKDPVLIFLFFYGTSLLLGLNLKIEHD